MYKLFLNYKRKGTLVSVFPNSEKTNAQVKTIKFTSIARQQQNKKNIATERKETLW